MAQVPDSTFESAPVAPIGRSSEPSLAQKRKRKKTTKEGTLEEAAEVAAAEEDEEEDEAYEDYYPSRGRVYK